MTRENIECMREVVLPFVKKKLLEINYEDLGKSDAEEFTRDFNEVLDLAIKAIEQEPRWIPVTEDAPPKGTVCLWCNKQGSVFTSEITYRSESNSYVGKHGYFSNGLENYGNIVAWMPLPKAYGEVEE